MRDFPPEIIFRVFTFLDARELLLCASRVCSLWYAFSNDDPLWKPLCLRHWKYLTKTSEQLRQRTIPWKSFFIANFDKASMRYLVIGAEGGGDKDERLEDVRSKLLSSGVGAVDTYNARIKTPTYDLFGKYNAVLFFSYHGFNQQELGNMLAQYVDDGGGVVVGTYSNCGRGNRLEGRWADGGYDPIALGSTSRVKSLALGKVADGNHPILRGVKAFNGGTQSSHGDGKAHPEARVVAEWTSGRPLIAEVNKFAGTIVGLNFYPPSADAAEGCWDTSTDGKLIISNALYHVTFANRL